VTTRDTVIFDGDCGVCTALKNWAEGFDADGRLEFVAFQTADLDSISLGLTAEMTSQALYFVQQDGKRFGGARALFETMRRLPGVWGIMGSIWAFPPLSLLAEPFYRLFARYRGYVSRRLGLERCDLPASDL
jgi:predicted DCC family thiol-disulfide oxidoreductase YuxK